MPFTTTCTGLGFSYYDRAQTSQIISRCTADIEAVRMFLSAGLLNLIQICLVVLGVGYLLLSFNWQLALITLAFMPVIFWQTLYVSKFLQPVWSKLQQLIGSLGVILQESFLRRSSKCNDPFFTTLTHHLEITTVNIYIL